MKRALVTVAVVLAFMGWARPAHAQGEGFVVGIELCPQTACGGAVFYGAFQFGADPGFAGAFTAFIQHADLPEAGQIGALTAGVVQLQAGTQVFLFVMTEGVLINNDDGTYRVLALFTDGAQFLLFDGTLDHNFFPPLIYGNLIPLAIPD
jgi:hypothetical protein